MYKQDLFKVCACITLVIPPSIPYIDSFLSRFSCPAAYVNYIRKDPGAPCSLTEALEYLQVDILEDLMKNDSLSANQVPPKHKPHNLTVVAMEGCHSFIILDWARPLKDDMVSGNNFLAVVVNSFFFVIREDVARKRTAELR